MLDPPETASRLAETKRRRRELLAVAIASIILIAFVLAQTTLPPLTSHTSLVSNLVVILLFDLSFILLGLMLILVGRNLAKAVFERRRGLIGSKLQARLVFGFSAVALVPSVFLLYVSGTFLHADIEGWFNPEYEKVLDNSLEIAKVYYLNSANNAAHFARVLSGLIVDRKLLDPARRDGLRKFIEKFQQEDDLGTVEVFSSDRKLLMLGLSPHTPTGIGVSPESEIVTGTLKGHPMTRTDRFGGADVIRGTAPIYASKDSDTVVGAIVIDYYLPRSLAEPAAGISRGVQEYFQLRILRQPIMHSYVLALILIGLAVVLLASWFGIYIARGITGPIRLLAEGTQNIASGNLNVRIPAVGDDEIGHLVDSFNQMANDLRTSRAEIERRRRYTETLLRNVSAGVVGLDSEHRIIAMNRYAERMLGLTAAKVFGLPYGSCFHRDLVAALKDYFDDNMPRREMRFPLKIEIGGAETDLMVTATPFAAEDDSEKPDVGSVLFFEDVSQLAKIERMEAWREVARRIAHEIKNPLTPIQLSAERLRRQLRASSTHDARLLEECTHTIIGEVEELKHLVNEFSGFARMPQLNPVPGDLTPLVEEVVNNFRAAFPTARFSLSLQSALPPIAIDREALKRALVNLIDNAVAASTEINHNGQQVMISVVTKFDAASGIVSLEIADNGPGIDPKLRARIFEPYFSTKKGGTGLGLPIVASIITDHHGFVRVHDHPPHGSTFVLEFPIIDQLTSRLLAVL